MDLSKSLTVKVFSFFEETEWDESSDVTPDDGKRWNLLNVDTEDFVVVDVVVQRVSLFDVESVDDGTRALPETVAFVKSRKRGKGR